MSLSPNGPLRVGVGGPVGTGKTALMDALCKHFRNRYDIAAITNDIYTKEDAEFLTRAGSLPPERILGIETGGCPHTAIREDASINLAGVAELRRKFPQLDLILIESGGDNLAATFSPELADLTIYVIDVSAGDKIPRKGGPGITRSDMLVINKIDLAPYVGASLEVMDRDAKKMRGEQYRSFLLTFGPGPGLPTSPISSSARAGLRLSPVALETLRDIHQFWAMTILPSPQQLRYLVMLAESRHFGRAALACAVTQSTLSAGILTLERQLDAQILDRAAGKHVVFTPPWPGPDRARQGSADGAGGRDGNRQYRARADERAVAAWYHPHHRTVPAAQTDAGAARRVPQPAAVFA